MMWSGNRNLYRSVEKDGLRISHFDSMRQDAILSSGLTHPSIRAFFCFLASCGSGILCSSDLLINCLRLMVVRPSWQEATCCCRWQPFLPPFFHARPTAADRARHCVSQSMNDGIVMEPRMQTINSPARPPAIPPVVRPAETDR